MANSANVRAALRVDVVIDSNATAATGTPVTVLCNRQYSLIDFKFNVSAVSAVADGSLLIESVTSGVATTVGTVIATGAVTANLQRPTIVTLTPGTTNGLAAAAAVARGSTLRVSAFATPGADNGSPIRATGTIVVLPGNRYAAGAGTYYPNNSAALQS
jgi:hypothetical protein